LDDLYALAKDRRQNRVVASYTNYLQDRGSDYITRKVGEESLELVLALKDENKDHIIHETADVLYHITIALENLGIKWSEISEELEIRRKNDNDIHTIKDESEF
ncbi:MAG: phosphoribosyl-ATP diphosphatase, partial [Clostridiaceae bacterium]|nr:phosphoribosyl-ATP diphosphatase [Clostridiaceae bacterium]